MTWVIGGDIYVDSIVGLISLQTLVVVYGFLASLLGLLLGRSSGPDYFRFGNELSRDDYL